MAAVNPINVAPVEAMRVGLEVGAQLEVAAIAPLHAVPAPVGASPVDAAAAGASTAMQTKMTAMQSEIGTKGPDMQAAVAASAAALQAQDANNASPLKDLASAIPSGGSSGGGSSSTSGSKNGIHGLDYTTGDGRKVPSPPRPPAVIDQSKSEPPPKAPHPPPPPDPKHTSITGQPVCPGDQIIGNLMQILLGGAGIGLAVPGEVVTGGAATVVLGGAAVSIYQGIDGLERCPK